MHKQIFAAVLFLALATGTAGSQERINTGSDDVAVEGYDVVAYFIQRTAVPGNLDISVEHNGAIYRFVSAEHRDLFTADPEMYVPAYGGFCAWAVSRGYTAGIDPEVWTIHDGRLFLNFDSRVGRRFTGDLDANVIRADANWIEMAR